MNGYIKYMESPSAYLQNNLIFSEPQKSSMKNKKISLSYEEVLESEIRRLTSVLEGHSNEVTDLVLTSDNNSLISCGKDNTLRVWSLIRRVQEQKYEIEITSDEFISSMSLSPDDKFIVLIISEKYLMIKTLENLSSKGKVINEKFNFKSKVSISNDCQHFCVVVDGKVEDSDKVNVYDMNGTMIKSYLAQEEFLSFGLFIDNIIIIGNSYGKVKAWNISTNEKDEIEKKDDLRGLKVGLVFENNHYLALGYCSGKVIFLDLFEKSSLAVITACFDVTITNISYSSNSQQKTIICSNDNNELIFIDFTTKTIIRKLTPHSKTINKVLQTQDGRLVISASSDNLIKIWEQGEDRSSRTSSLFGKNIKFTTFSNEQKQLAVIYNDNTVKVVDLDKDKEELMIKRRINVIYAAIWCENQRKFITSDSTPQIAVYSYEDKSVEFTIFCQVAIKFLALSPDSRILYGCSGESKIFSWDLEDKVLSHIFEKEGNYSLLAFSCDWSKMYSGGLGLTTIWDLKSKSVEVELEENSLVSLLPLSNGKTLISGHEKAFVNFWNLGNNVIDFVYTVDDKQKIITMDLFKQEKFLAVVTESSCVEIINIEKKLKEFDFFTTPEPFLAKVINGDTLIITDLNSIHFWNLENQQEEGIIMAHLDRINCLLLHQDSQNLLSFSSDGSIKSWKINDKSENEPLIPYYGSIKSGHLITNRLVLGNDKGTVFSYYWIMGAENSIRSEKILQVHNSSINSLDYFNGNFVSASDDTRVAVFELNYKNIEYFKGHLVSVRCAKFSHNGRLVYSGSDDGLIKVWNIQNKNLWFELDGHLGPVKSLCVFPSGQYLASTSGDEKVKLWNLVLRNEIYSFENHCGKSNALCLSDDESTLFSSLSDNSIAAIDLNSKKLLCSFNGHSSSLKNLFINNNILFSTSIEGIKNWYIKSKREFFTFRWSKLFINELVLSPDENYLAAVQNDQSIIIYNFKKSSFFESFRPFQISSPKLSFSNDSKSLIITGNGTILTWDIENNKEKSVINIGLNYINYKFSDDFSLLATLSNESFISIWNWNEKKVVNRLLDSSSYSRVMIFSHDNKFLFVGFENRQISMWNLETLEKFEFEVSCERVFTIALSPSRNLMISGGEDYESRINFIDLKNKDLFTCDEDISQSVSILVVTKDEKFMISAGSYDGFLGVWNLDTRRMAFKLRGSPQCVKGLAISSDNNNFFVGSYDCSIINWSLSQKKMVRYLKTTCGNINSIALNKEGTRAYLGSSESTINILDLKSKKETDCLYNYSENINDFFKDSINELVLSDDETLLVIGSETGVKVYQTKTLERTLSFKQDKTNSVAITKNNEFVISGSQDGSLIIWNLKNKEKEFSFESINFPIKCLRLAFDEKFLISSASNQIKVWDIQKKSEIFTFNGHAWDVTCLAIFNYKKNFVSGSNDMLIKIWSLEDKRVESTLRGHTGRITAVILTSDDKRLISGAEDSRINVWNLDCGNVECCIDGNNFTISALKITHQGNLLLTAGTDQSLKLWRMGDLINRNDQSESLVKVNTPDDKFEMTYLFGTLRKVFKKGSPSILEMGISDVYDPFYQDSLKFYNVIDSIKNKELGNFIPSCSNLVFSQFSFTILHYLALTGNSKRLAECLSENIQLKADYFGKSPFYYAISKNNQECVEVLLKFLINLAKSDDISKAKASISAISEDIPIIIKNSSKRVRLLIKTGLIPIDPALVLTEEQMIGDEEERIEKIEENLESQREESRWSIKKLEDKLSSQVIMFHNKTQDRISIVEGRLDKLEEKFDGLNEKINRILEFVKDKSERKLLEGKNN